MEKLTLLITGASGFVGSALSKHLGSRYRILSLKRDDLVLPQVDGIINLTGAPINRIWLSKVRQEIVSSRIDTTQKLVSQILTQKKPPQFFFSASGTGYYGDRGEESLTEKSAIGSGFLSSVCQAWESASIPLEQRGIRRVLARFGVVLGAGGGMLQALLPFARLHLAGRLGTGNQWMSWIALHDLVRAIDFLIQHPQIEGPINFTAPHPLRQKEFSFALAIQLHALGQLPQPAIFLRLFLGDMAKELLLASTKAFPKKILDAGFQFEQPDIQVALHKALHLLK